MLAQCSAVSERQGHAQSFFTASWVLSFLYANAPSQQHLLLPLSPSLFEINYPSPSSAFGSSQTEISYTEDTDTPIFPLRSSSPNTSPTHPTPTPRQYPMMRGVMERGIPVLLVGLLLLATVSPAWARRGDGFGPKRVKIPRPHRAPHRAPPKERWSVVNSVLWMERRPGMHSALPLLLGPREEDQPGANRRGLDKPGPVGCSGDMPPPS